MMVKIVKGMVFVGCQTYVGEHDSEWVSKTDYQALEQQLEDANAELAKYHWVSVDDGLPEVGEWVLASTETYAGDAIVKELFLDSIIRDKAIWLAEGDWPYPVTRWMPLLPPHKQESE